MLFDFKRKPKYAFDDDDVIDDDFGTYNDTDDMDDINEPVQAPVAPAEPIVPAPSFSAAPAALKIISPKTYEDAREVADFLMNGNTIVLNMDGINREVAVRVIDYLKGAVYVVGGMMTKAGKTTLVVAPKNVDVSSIEAMVGGNNAD